MKSIQPTGPAFLIAILLPTAIMGCRPQHDPQTSSFPNGRPSGYSASSAEDPIATPYDPCSPALGFDDQVDKAISMARSDDDSIVLKNVSQTCVRGFTLADDGKRYLVGSFDASRMIDDMITPGKATESEEGKARAIWQWTSGAFDHFCSMGAPSELVRNQASLLKNTLSYSFGCCSDINWPIQATLLRDAGLEVNVLKAPAHVSTQVVTEGGTFFADAAHSNFLQGSVLDFSVDYYRDLFSPDNLAIYGTYPLKRFDDGSFGNAALTLLAEDELVFTNEPLALAKIPRIGWMDDGGDYTQFAHEYIGRAKLSFAQFLGRESEEEDGLACRDYDVSSPYIMVESAVSGLSSAGRIYLFSPDHESLFPFPRPKNGHRTPLTLEGDYDALLPSPDLHLWTDSPDFSWGRYDFSIRLCDEASSLDKAQVNFEFMYNHNIFPSHLDSLKVVSATRLAFDVENFTTAESTTKVSGRYPEGTDDLSISQGTVTSEDPKSHRWAGEVVLLDGENEIELNSRDSDGMLHTTKISVTRVPSAKSPTIEMPDLTGVASGQTISLTGSCVKGVVTIFEELGFQKTPCVGGRWTASQTIHKPGANTYRMSGERNTSGHEEASITFTVP